MKGYIAKLVMVSPSATPLLGDTIFGHVCWGIARKQGRNKIEKFLQAFSEDEEAPFAVSSAFPSGRLPYPMLSPKIDFDKDVRDYAKSKKIKKTAYVSADLFFRGGFRFSQKSLRERIENIIDSQTFSEITRLHSTINRVTGTTTETTGLFSSKEIYFQNSKEKRESITPPVLDIYIKSVFDREKIRSLLNDAFDAGFGADASVGMGNIQIISIEELKFPDQGNRYLALGPFVPSYKETERLQDLHYGTFTRFGKLGGEFVHQMNPFKKPLIMFKEGTTFSSDISIETVGTLMSVIHTNASIRHCALTPVLRFYEED